MFDYNALRGRMAEQQQTQSTLSKACHISLTQLNGKLNGKYPFTQRDIDSICRVLEILPEDIGHYFFTPAVEKTQLAV